MAVPIRKSHIDIDDDIARAIKADKAKNGERNISQTLRRWKEAIEKDAATPYRW